MPKNLKHISQAAWRVAIVHWVAKAVGLLAHVEGMPIGSARNIKPLKGGVTGSKSDVHLVSKGSK